MDQEDEFLELPDEELSQETSEMQEKKLIAMISEIHKQLKKLSQALGAKYPYPAAGYPGKYPYPKSQSEDALEKLEKEKKELEEKNKELTKKLDSFERKEKEALITDYLNELEEKGAIEPEQREEIFKDYSENFSIEQIEKLKDTFSKMDFSKAKAKSFKATEIPKEKAKDLEKRKKILERKIKTLEDSGVKGPVYENYLAELEKLTEAS